MLGWPRPGRLSRRVTGPTPGWPLTGAPGTSWGWGCRMLGRGFGWPFSSVEAVAELLPWELGEESPRATVRPPGPSPRPRGLGLEPRLGPALLPPPGQGGGHRAVCQPVRLVKPGPTPAFGVLPSPGKPRPGLGRLGRAAAATASQNEARGPEPGCPAAGAGVRAGGSVGDQPSLCCAWGPWLRATPRTATSGRFSRSVRVLPRRGGAEAPSVREAMLRRRDPRPGDAPLSDVPLRQQVTPGGA